MALRCVMTVPSKGREVFCSYVLYCYLEGEEGLDKVMTVKDLEKWTSKVTICLIHTYIDTTTLTKEGWPSFLALFKYLFWFIIGEGVLQCSQHKPDKMHCLEGETEQTRFAFVTVR